MRRPAALPGKGACPLTCTCTQKGDSPLSIALPSVLLTAKGQEFDRQRGVQVGAALYRTKPFDPDALLMKAREPGDTLLLNSDGVIDAQNVAGEEFGEDRLSVIVRECRHLGATELIANVFDQIDAFAAEAPQFDDITILAIKRGGSHDT